MKKTVHLLLVIAALFVAALFCPTVSAADVIIPGDYAILGEKNLDFTTFSNGGVYDGMVYVTTLPDWRWSFVISSSVNLENLEPGTYVPCNLSSQNYNPGNKCYIVSPDTYPLHYEDDMGNNVTNLQTAINEELTFFVKGKPGATYQIFKNDALWKQETLVRNTAHPGVELKVNSSDLGKMTIKTVNKNDAGENAALSISFIPKSDYRSIIFSMTYPDLIGGRFAVGDEIKVSGALTPSLGSDGSPVYLYITGVNLPASGVNFDGEPVVDGVASSFTSTIFSAGINMWTVDWDTNGFEPGTYTIHASLDPVGYQDDNTMAGVVTKSQEITLSDKSIHVKFAEENSGRFTQGDVIYSYWSARGSPEGIRWYIVGTNFLESGISSGFPLYTVDQEKGVNAPQGVYGFTYDRYFSQSMAPGNYYLIYQHPGYDNRFDVYPDRDGSFTSLQTTFGESADVSARPMENVAEVIRTLIKNSLSDDLYVISDITIESPRITIDQVENLAIGDSLKIRGTTNYAGTGTTADNTQVTNTFSLKINRLDFELTEENAAMQMQVVSRVTPENQIPYYGERTYAFDAIDTSTWFEGTYEAVVTNVDTGFSKTMTFTVGGEGIEKDSETLQVSSDLVPDEIPDEIEDELLYPIEPVSIPDEPAPSSPGFILAPLGLAAAFILRRK